MGVRTPSPLGPHLKHVNKETILTFVCLWGNLPLYQLINLSHNMNYCPHRLNQLRYLIQKNLLYFSGSKYCRSGYTKVKEFCYLFHTEKGTFEIQKEYCSTQGGYLATIKTAYENTVFTQYLTGEYNGIS